MISRNWMGVLGVLAALTVAGTLSEPVVVHRWLGPHRSSATVRASSGPGWTWPANPVLIPGLLASDQEIALNAQVYPVAFVPVTDTTGLQQLQRLATTKSITPHRLGFLALVVAHPQSDQTAVATAARLMHRDQITLPWAVVIDPPVAWQTSTLQVYWPQDQHVEHAVGSAALTAWHHATASVAVTSVQIFSRGSKPSTTSTPTAKPHTLPTSGTVPSTRPVSPRRKS